MYIEITKEAFKTLVSSDLQAESVLKSEHAYYLVYFVKGVRLQQIEHHLTGTTTYHIQDINA